MSLLSKLLIAIFIAIIISQSYSIYLSENFPNWEMLGIFSLATIVTVVLGSLRPKRKSFHRNKNRDTDQKDRIKGTVKWFNGSKGFGFITLDGGDEIFVHFRSIRGGGRRVLRDGQGVTFRIADSSKGPQAEDVEII